MKNNLITQLATVLLLCLISWSLGAQSESVTVGTVKNGVATLSNPDAAQNFLKANLPVTASVSELRIDYADYEGKYYLIGKVSNDPVSAIGIRLTENNGELLGVRGVGAKVTCVGNPCPSCTIRIRKWNPWCDCNQSGGACNMILEGSVGIN